MIIHVYDMFARRQDRKAVEAVKDGVELAEQAYDSDVMQPIRDSVVNKVVDGLPGLLKLLDAAAEMHPFIASKLSS